jgi:copper chaperone
MQSFRTNIKCGGCVSKVKPYLDAIKGMNSWKVDLASPDRLLEIDGEVSVEDVIKALSAAGYRADQIRSGNKV